MMRNAFERAYDKKRNLMKDLRDSLDKNQQDYDSAVDSHMYKIDKMMGMLRKSPKPVISPSYLIHNDRWYLQNSGERD